MRKYLSSLSAIAFVIIALILALSPVSDSSPVQGDLLYYGGTAWNALTPGTSGQLLETLGSGANPQWTNAPSFAQATPAAGNCIGISTPPAAGTIAYTCPTPYPTPSGGSGLPVYPTPTPSPGGNSSPQPGWVSVQNGYYAGGPLASPNPPPGALYHWPSNCGGGQWSGLGPSLSSYNGVTADMFGVFCGTSLRLAYDASSGNLGTGGTLYPDANDNGTALTLQSGDQFNFSQSSTNDTSCLIRAKTGWGALEESAGSGTCSLSLDFIGTGNAVCTDDVNGNHNQLTACSSNTQNYGEVTCTLSTAVSCTATATVRSGARCQATYESTDTTVTLADLVPPAVHTSSTTATFTLQTNTSLTGTLAANYWCP